MQVVGQRLQLFLGLALLTSPLYAIAIVLLYYDLRVRQENYDLLIRIQRLESETGIQPGVP